MVAVAPPRGEGKPPREREWLLQATKTFIRRLRRCVPVGQE